MDPLSNDVRSGQSTEPRYQWPSPATNVSGTACAMSDPTMTAIGTRGYSVSSAVTPRAPAPTEETVTSTPSTTPVMTVRRAASPADSLSCSGPTSLRNRRRKNSDSAVSNSITPSTRPMIRPLVEPATSKWEIAARVTVVAGTLPNASRVTILQSTVWFRPCTRVPAVLVADAYSRSVPTAVAGCTPKTSTRI